jgi:phosphoribosylamine--glycine ligase
MPQRVLVVGNGGRDYVLGQCLGALPEVAAVYYAAGGENARAWFGEKYLPCPHQDVFEIAKFAQEKNVGLVIAGPEAPIAAGIAQACQELGVPVLAPSLLCAALETSKIFCKKVIQAAGVPTPPSFVVQWPRLKEAFECFLKDIPQDVITLPTVVKYDGLAAGKGVAVLHTKADVNEALSFFAQSLPDWEKSRAKLKSSTLEVFEHAPFLIEHLVEGEEISAIALCNGEEFRLLPLAKDYKRRNNGQTGPNTGGMGAVCPVPVSPALQKQMHQAFALTLKEMKSRGTPYQGFLFAGFMVDSQENAWLLEFNCRLGDPETQVILPGLGRDFWREVLQTAQQKPFFDSSPHARTFAHDGQKRVFVVGASPEYPQGTIPRRELGLPDGRAWQEVSAHHHVTLQWIPSGVEADGSTTAGRVCGMLGAAATWEQARAGVYATIPTITLEDATGVTQPQTLHYRTDIGLGLQD